jgi:hypothetical protein
LTGRRFPDPIRDRALGRHFPDKWHPVFVSSCRAVAPDKMSIFDDITSDDEGPPSQDETAFSYLNRSNRIEATRVRQNIDRWLEHYPKDHREALVGRLRSAIDDQHKSAFFELLMHELMLARSLKIIAIEPPIAHTKRLPDFFVGSDKGERFYLEAVTTTGRSKDDTAAQARLNSALAAINNTQSPAHFLDLTVRGVPSENISIRKMRRALRAWIESLPDGERAKDAAPFIFAEHEVCITIRAWPRHQRDPQASRAIGVRHFPLQQVVPHEDVHTALKKKASRYGSLDQPYVVAINSLQLFYRDDSVIDALLGTPILVSATSEHGNTTFREKRQPNGIWHGRKGPRKTELSAVLAMERIDPWNFAPRRAQLIRNPWGKLEFPHVSLGTDELNPTESVFKRSEGMTLGSILGLPTNWPED